jgi:hypothetical protein
MIPTYMFLPFGIQCIYRLVNTKQHNHQGQTKRCNFNELFHVVKKNCNKVKKTFIKTWLEERKANIRDAIQARKRKRAQPKALTKLLDGEEDDSVNKAASAKLSAAEETGMLQRKLKLN